MHEDDQTRVNRAAKTEQGADSHPLARIDL